MNCLNNVKSFVKSVFKKNHIICPYYLNSRFSQCNAKNSFEIQVSNPCNQQTWKKNILPWLFKINGLNFKSKKWNC
jgi:hypothetical protein